MLQVWQWISTKEIVYGYADRGLDYVTSQNADVGIMVLDQNGKHLLYCTQGELRTLANFFGYKTA